MCFQTLAHVYSWITLNAQSATRLLCHRRPFKQQHISAVTYNDILSISWQITYIIISHICIYYVVNSFSWWFVLSIWTVCYVKDSATFLWILWGECIVSNRRPHAVPDRVDRDNRPAGCLIHKAADHWPETASCQNIWHFQVFQTSDHPAYCILGSVKNP